METNYLIHLDRPFGHMRHYSGYTRRPLHVRLREHGTAKGAKVMRHVAAAGITWQLVRTWPGGRDRELQLKAQGGASRRCPVCTNNPRLTGAVVLGGTP